jgi:hypothetical protein
MLAVVSGDVERRGKFVQEEVATIVSMVVAFSVATLILLVLTGYPCAPTSANRPNAGSSPCSRNAIRIRY